MPFPTHDEYETSHRIIEARSGENCLHTSSKKGSHFNTHLRKLSNSGIMSSRYDIHGGEESALWSATVSDLRSLKEIHTTGEGFSRLVNRHRKGLQPLEDEAKIVDIVEKLENYSREYVSALETENKLLDSVRENIGLLIALRQATEAGLGGNDESRRKKRKMADLETSSDTPSKSKKRGLNDGFAPGAPVAFRQPKSKTSDGDWIQCNIVRILGEGAKGKCEVQDPEPDENGLPGQTYRTNLVNLIPIPRESIGLPPHPKGAHVLARYPETTTFYKAEVMASKRDICMLRFEGEEEIEKLTEVERRLVLDIPKHMTH